ncbi:cache domain-containing protein [Shumkonia mesophila]|uniref:cache domain-containing protein n=1 Tax=Shumkonia mesophila TaxID=2838854 RepID=UPI0029349B96|nr:cache domain-containing protein [Shumkonia mesophila]
MKKNKPSIATLPTSRTSLAAVAAVFLIGVIWGWRDYSLLDRQLGNDLILYETQRRAALERTVRDTVRNIQFLRTAMEDGLRTKLHVRMTQARAVARGICAGLPPGDCRAKAADVREALRQIRFNAGRSYFFAFDLDGIGQLFPPAPDLEGAPIPGIGGLLRIARTQGEGFLRHERLAPDGGDERLRLSFVEVFDSLDWAIGVSADIGEIEAGVQAEALATLEATDLGDASYLFAGTWDGLSLVGPAKGRNMWEVEDRDGFMVVQGLVRAARIGGGFVEYTMPPINGEKAYPKISFVAGIPEWRWYVGAGDSMEAITKAAAGRREAGQRRMILEVAIVGLIALALAGLILLRGGMAGRRARQDFRRFLDFLDRAARADVALDPDGMAFVEFAEAAQATNRLLEDKNAAMRELERQRAALDKANEELELRVQARTRELEGEVIERKYAETELLRTNDSLEQRIAESTRHLREQIAARERIESQFIQAQKMEAVGQLAGGFAHDFNNILTVITSTLGILNALVPSGDERVAKAIALAEGATKRAGDLTRRMLVFSREMDTRPEAVDPAELVLALQPLIERALRESIVFKVECAPDVWPVVIDPVLLENAVVNIALNAQDAMTDGGRFFLSIRNLSLGAEEAASHPDAHAGDYVEFAMKDTGTGIPPDILGRIFEPFFSTKPKGAGTGLGLSMVLAFARRSGGFVKVMSEEGRGTTFRILLPRGDRPAAAKALAVSGKPGRPLAGLRIVVAEDDPLVRDVTVAALMTQGVDVTAVSDGPRAVAALELRGPYDVVVSDLIMPGGMSGLDLRDLVAVRWPACRVLLMTGYSYSEFARRGVDPTTLALLRKPFSRDELVAAIVALEPTAAA